jgi:ATP-dependent DNA helicase RecG
MTPLELLRQLNKLDEHPRIEAKEASAMGKSVLETGKGSATYYVPTDRFVTSLSQDLSGAEPHPTLSGYPHALSGNPQALSGNPQALSGNLPALPRDLPAEIAKRIRTLGQRVSQPDLAQLTMDLCRHRPFSADELATTLGKTRKHVLERALTPLLRSGQLRHTIPDQPNHPDQAYTIADSLPATDS